MLLLQTKDIKNLGITPGMCMEWIEESFMIKKDAVLPPKTSIHPQGGDFFNTMPSLLPTSYGRFSVKEVHRIAGQTPTLGGDLLLYDSRSGELLSMMDSDWITTMRTGAVAALACRLFEKEGVDTYSFIGLGNTARATALCLLADKADRPVKFRLLRYKDQAESFVERFKEYGDRLSFEIVDSAAELVSGADVLLSCLTEAKELVCPDDSLYREGVLVVPVHTKGFQNCDLFFDKVFGDDTGHIRGFKYFDKFAEYHELDDVLSSKIPGRVTQNERILSYNIGIGLHDAVFASKIFDMVPASAGQNIIIERETAKFWI